MYLCFEGDIAACNIFIEYLILRLRGRKPETLHAETTWNIVLFSMYKSDNSANDNPTNPSEFDYMEHDYIFQ